MNTNPSVCLVSYACTQPNHPDQTASLSALLSIVNALYTYSALPILSSSEGVSENRPERRTKVKKSNNAIANKLSSLFTAIQMDGLTVLSAKNMSVCNGHFLVLFWSTSLHFGHS